MTLGELEEIIRDRKLIGVNIHLHPNGEWSCWTRQHGSDGWARSGTHPTLEEAVGASLDIEDLV